MTPVVTMHVWVLYTMILGMGTPNDVDTFLTKTSCEHAKAEAKELLARALVMNENAELRRIKFVGCDLPVEIPVPDISEAQLYR